MMEMMMRQIPIALLHELIICAPETGELFWKHRDAHHFSETHVWKTWNTRYAHKPALNCINGTGYKAGTVKGVRVPAHRVIWAMTFGAWPSEDIDHINGNRADNRIENLRAVCRQENTKNRAVQNNSTSLVPGVTWAKKNKKWRARITISGNRVDLGLYEDFENAVTARKKAERLYGYHPNNGRIIPMRASKS